MTVGASVKTLTVWLLLTTLCTLALSTTALGTPALARERLELRALQLPLPGAPASIIPADVDGDGIQDLTVVVAFTEWDQIGVEETTRMDAVEGLVEMMTIVPVLFDRRELHWLRGLPQGGFESAGTPLPLDRSVLTVEAGPPGVPVVLLTDDGLSMVRPSAGSDGPALELVSLIARGSVLSGSGSLLPTLDLLQDYDGDGEVDLLLPEDRHWSIYRSGTLRRAAEGLVVTPDARIPLPESEGLQSEGREREYALPVAEDVNGDGVPDLVARLPSDRPRAVQVLLQDEGATADYGEPRLPLLGAEPAQEPLFEPRSDLVHFGDLDGDGLAEVVTAVDLSDDDAGWRKELKQAKRPPSRYSVRSIRPDLSVVPDVNASFEAIGYAFDDGDPDDAIRLPGGFQDLDGDGRKDLIAITLDFSLLQAIRILATRSISIGIDFHVYCQDRDGGFDAVEGLDLSGKFRLRLDDLRLGQLSQFAGDFDGDGRADFVQIGRGRKVSVHLGGDGCRYPTQPDLVIKLEEEPSNLALVQVRDLDGDALADLLVIQPRDVSDKTVTAPVRLDLYLSRRSG